jgi:hypothetical protein
VCVRIVDFAPSLGSLGYHVNIYTLHVAQHRTGYRSMEELRPPTVRWVADHQLRHVIRTGKLDDLLCDVSSQPNDIRSELVGELEIASELAFVLYGLCLTVSARRLHVHDQQVPF